MTNDNIPARHQLSPECEAILFEDGGLIIQDDAGRVAMAEEATRSLLVFLYQHRDSIAARMLSAHDARMEAINMQAVAHEQGAAREYDIALREGGYYVIFED